ncbi:hypothetical protein KY289_031382 [Solanum tuberosum]|nr:hypothetical protein KY289_031382 [Solanum tuberosum]
MERVVNLGPIDRTLLLSQHEHKSELLWKGEISFTSLMRTTTLSPLSSPDVTFIMPVADMPQTPGRKKVVKRIVKNVNIKDLLAKKRKRDNEDEGGYTGLRPRDVLRISRKGCGT